MKKLIALSLILAALLMGCNKLKTLPDGVLEKAAGGPDNSTYTFDSTMDGFVINASGDNVCFKTAVITAEKFYMGLGCVKINAIFTGAANNRGGIIQMNNSTVDMAGKTLSAYVWCPSGLFDSSNPYGATFFIQLGAAGNYDWYQSTWQNLNLPTSGVKGVWNKISFYVDDMTLANGNGSPGHITGNTVLQNGANVNVQFVWGLKIGMGDSSPAYSGTMYIDSINLE
jgi:hypothetical protein